MADKLTPAERAELIEPLLANGWTIADGRDAIQKTFEFLKTAWANMLARWIMHKARQSKPPRNGCLKSNLNLIF